jgi:heme oxygenase (biliverdin-IX-beta and delta-forming)
MRDINASARSPAHEQLRSSTRHLHQLVDSRFDLASISSEPAYTAFLLANWPFASIEVGLERAGIQNVLPDWGKRRRRDALAEDIRQCGISPPSIDRLEIDSDHGALLGWSYVLEGSRLGAGIILQATKRHGEKTARGTRFLQHGVGEHLWRDFKIALAKIDKDPPAVSKACVAAGLAFHCFLSATGP